jgi:hypothetical protein
VTADDFSRAGVLWAADGSIWKKPIFLFEVMLTMAINLVAILLLRDNAMGAAWWIVSRRVLYSAALRSSELNLR